MDPNGLRRILFEEYDGETEYLLNLQEIAPDLAPRISERFFGSIHLPADSCVHLSRRQVAELGEDFKIFPNQEGDLCRLQIIDLDNDLPYLTHTNRELALMKTGRKPLSVFSGHQISDIESLIYAKHFDSLVKSGQLSTAEYNLTAERKLLPGSRSDKNFTLMYAMKGEEWRMDTYVLLRNTVAHVGLWSDDYERVFGSLLGYTDVENDAWIARRKAWGLRWGYATVYFRPTTDDLRCLESSGLARLSGDSSDTIDLYISQEGLAPIFERLSGAERPYGNTNVARFNLSLRSLKMFQSLTSGLQHDQFGPFAIRRDKMAELSCLAEGKVEILPLRL